MLAMDLEGVSNSGSGFDSPEQGYLTTQHARVMKPGLSSTCGICGDPFKFVHSLGREVDRQAEEDILLSLFPASNLEIERAEEVPVYGTQLCCPKSHVYCSTCISTYISRKLDGSQFGAAKVFPIACPGCLQEQAGYASHNVKDWKGKGKQEWCFDEAEANRVLSGSLRKRFVSLCSAFLARREVC